MTTVAGVLAGRRSLVLVLLLLAIVGIVLVPSVTDAAPSPPVAAQIGPGGLCALLQSVFAGLPPFVQSFLAGILGFFGCASP